MHATIVLQAGRSLPSLLFLPSTPLPFFLLQPQKFPTSSNQKPFLPQNVLVSRLGGFLEKWSDSVSYLSIVIVCANLKNATPILVPRPKYDITRPP